jgi:hypothetical protein
MPPFPGHCNRPATEGEPNRNERNARHSPGSATGLQLNGEPGRYARERHFTHKQQEVNSS